MVDNAILVISDLQDIVEAENNTIEMNLLCESAGVHVIEEYHFKRQKPDPNYHMGTGHADMLSTVIAEIHADVIIFSEDLSPAQIRNLERVTDCRVVDRTQLILDIFAQRAKSNEGKIQVELAQLQYLLPRLTGKGIEMSRIGGGSGGGVATRGPGETKLETDRRRIKDKITNLKKDLDIAVKQRQISSKERLNSNIPLVSLIGYTSAGKSTLLNKLSNESVFADKMLFATLDPVTRRVAIPLMSDIFLTDTVGFLSRLPHGIIAAFRSTLEETKNADILIHVVDATHHDMEGQIDSVNKVLKELKWLDKPVIMAFNKIDKLDSTDFLREIIANYKYSTYISALTGDGIENLFNVLKEVILTLMLPIKIMLPFDKGDLLAICYKHGKVTKCEHLDTGTYIEVSLPQEITYYFQDYKV